MEKKLYGKQTWFFPDCDLLAPGDKEPHGHESLIILNPNAIDATVRITVFHRDKEPDHLEEISISAQRVRWKSSAFIAGGSGSLPQRDYGHHVKYLWTNKLYNYSRDR